jgi:GNAT superfamily N-acetyltransferase
MLTNDPLHIVIQNPSTASHLEQRELLLSAALREQPMSWDYKSEYPLVLTESNLKTSWCIFSRQKLVAHASLWPRTLTHRSRSNPIDIGLVGNVATHPDFRGLGLMSNLVAHLVKTAQEYNMSGLVLWSDLLEFYQKLGFSSIGREIRFVFGPSDHQGAESPRRVDPHLLTVDDLERMLQLRPKFEWTVSRSCDEFRSLLAIPNASVFLRRQDTKILSWLVIGKGTDLQGIVHEWGAPSPRELISDLRMIINTWNLPQLVVLCPANIPKQWVDTLTLNSLSKEEHPMALAKPLGHKGAIALSAINRSFFWGFDSI